MGSRGRGGPGTAWGIALDVLLVAAFSTTAAFASDPPDSATNPLSGYNEVTDSALTNGNYEVRGKMPNGKIREVEVKADGTFVEME